MAAKIAEVKRILRLTGAGRSHQVHYGGWSGKGDEIAIATRSMLQVMMELGIFAVKFFRLFEDLQLFTVEVSKNSHL